MGVVQATDEQCIGGEQQHPPDNQHVALGAWCDARTSTSAHHCCGRGRRVGSRRTRGKLTAPRFVHIKMVKKRAREREGGRRGQATVSGARSSH